MQEEIQEVKEALAEENEDKVHKELGDLLFAAVNLSRFLGADPEVSLNRTSDRFIRRITKMEELLSADHLTFRSLSLEKLDEYWEIAKKEEKK